MANDLQLQLVATLLRRGKAIDRLSSAVLLLALAIGLSPLLGMATSLPAAGLCTALVVLG